MGIKNNTRGVLWAASLPFLWECVSWAAIPIYIITRIEKGRLLLQPEVCPPMVDGDVEVCIEHYIYIYRYHFSVLPILLSTLFVESINIRSNQYS